MGLQFPSSGLSLRGLENQRNVYQQQVYLKTRTVFKYNRSKKNPLYEHAEQLIASTSHRLMRSFGQLRTTIQTRIKIAESKKNSQTDRHAFSRTDRQEYDHLPQDFCLENESLAISHSRRREGFFAFFAT